MLRQMGGGRCWPGPGPSSRPRPRPPPRPRGDRGYMPRLVMDSGCSVALVGDSNDRGYGWQGIVLVGGSVGRGLTLDGVVLAGG